MNMNRYYQGRRPEHMDNGQKHRDGTDPETDWPVYLDREVFVPGIGWKSWKLLDRHELRLTELRYEPFTQTAQFAKALLALHMTQDDPALTIGEVYRQLRDR